MSWMNMLYQTYENNRCVAGKIESGVTLSVIAHMTVNSQLEIILNEKGEFCSANKIDKEDSKILIPVTESSASRSSGIAPHVLSDTLSYIAGDYEQYVEDEKIKRNVHNKNEAFLTQLKKWDESANSHKKEHIILLYLQKKEVIKDLIAAGILNINEKGYLCEDKISGQPYEKVMVRYIILSDNPKEIKETWRDQSLMEAYTKYYLSSLEGEKDICQITGEMATTTNNHPKGIIPANYGAKLISTNDNSNFTYRGRFEKAQEACTISYEASQKAHSALTWLAAKQGVTIGTQDKRTYICWNPKGKDVPYFDEDFGELDIEDESSNTEEQYKLKLYEAIQGKTQGLEDSDDIVIIGLDAATTGRLSVIYYNELKFSFFRKRLTDWNTKCSWYFGRSSSDGKPCEIIRTPNANEIVRFALGTEQGQYVEVPDKVLKEQVQRIYYCILDGKPISKDLVHAIVCKAANPMAHSKLNYERVLSTACAMIKAEKGNVSMELDKNCDERNYLFGRLLAVAEVAEKVAMNNSTDRITNAARLQGAFVTRPFTTWKNIQTALIPYLERMQPGRRNFYENIIEEIMCLFKEEDLKTMNKSLEAAYLLGYYQQRRDLRKGKGSIEVKKEEE